MATTPQLSQKELARTPSGVHPAGGQDVPSCSWQKKAKAGFNLVITPDGPRGPVYQVQDGIIKLAQLTGQKILPVTYDATKKRRLKSWDKFIIVKPFGKVHMAFGEPITIPKGANSEQIEQYRQQLQTSLLELNRICAEKLGLDETESQK